MKESIPNNGISASAVQEDLENLSILLCFQFITAKVAKVKRYETLAKYITMNFDGLHDTIEKLLAKQSHPVNTQTFSNDMITFKNKDDILTLLVHLGYLGYNAYNHTVYIPNEETFNEFLINMESNKL